MNITLTVPPIELELSGSAVRAMRQKLGLLTAMDDPQRAIAGHLSDIATKAASDAPIAEINQVTTNYLMDLGKRTDEAQAAMESQRTPDPQP
jgi:hypothetical protein